MVQSRPIKNIDNPPYFFGIRGKFFMEFILFCSAANLAGIMGGMILWIIGLPGFGAIIFISGIVLSVILYIIYQRKSKVVPFRDLRKTADLIGHINFNHIIE